MKKQDKILYDGHTPYGHLQVTETWYGNEPVRILEVNGQMESAVYLRPEKADELVFPYTRLFGYPYALFPDLKRTLLIGGGGFMWPAWYLKHLEDRTIDTAEISPDIIQAAKQYFAGPEIFSDSRLRVIQDDGFKWLRESDEVYDVIINDAFIGSKDAGNTPADLRMIHEHLSAQGVYMVNTVSAAKGLFAWRGRRLLKAMHEVFANTEMIFCEDEDDVYRRQNLLIIASDRQLNTEEL